MEKNELIKEGDNPLRHPALALFPDYRCLSLSPWGRQLHDLFCVPGFSSRGTQQSWDVILSPTGIRCVLLLDLPAGKTEASECSRKEDGVQALESGRPALRFPHP